MGEIKGPVSRSVLSLDFWQNKQHLVTKAGHRLAPLQADTGDLGCLSDNTLSSPGCGLLWNTEYANEAARA